MAFWSSARCAEGRESGIGDVGVGSLVIGGASERRVHDHDVEFIVWNVHGDHDSRRSAHRACPVRTGRLAGVEQGQLTYPRCAAAPGSRWHHAAVGPPPVGEGCRGASSSNANIGMRAGKGRARDVDGRRHHVAAVERTPASWWRAGSQPGLPPGPFVAGGYLRVHRRQQRAGSAQAKSPIRSPADCLGDRTSRRRVLGRSRGRPSWRRQAVRAMRRRRW